MTALLMLNDQDLLSSPTRQIERLLDRVRDGVVPLPTAVSELEELLDHTDWKGNRSDEVILCCTIGRVAMAAGAEHAARRALARGRVRLQPGMARGLNLLLRVMEIDLHGMVGNEARSASELADLLKDLSDPDCHLAQLFAFKALMSLLLGSDSLKSAEALNEWMSRHADRDTGLLHKARFIFLLWSQYVAHRRCELAHPYHRDSLLPGAIDEDPLPFEEALLSLEETTAAMLEGNNLLKEYPRLASPLTFTWDALRDAAVQAQSLMRGEPRGESAYVSSYETALSRGSLSTAAQAADALTPRLIDTGRASLAARMFVRIKQSQQELPLYALRLVEYGLYKTSEAVGHASGALAAYRRYVAAVRSHIANPVLAPAFALPIVNGPSVLAVSQSCAPSYVRKAIRIMQDSFNDRRLSLSDVAQMAGVSDRTLRAAFALHVGASPYQYLLGLRLDAARDRLDKDADGTRTLVRSLANDCGFEHAGRFAKAFAARYGCSPRDYAKRSATKGSRAVGGDY